MLFRRIFPLIKKTDLKSNEVFVNAVGRYIDRNKFTRIRDDKKPPAERKQISDRYFRKCLFFAIEFYGNDVASAF